MRQVITFEEFILESKKQTFSKGCVMVYMDLPKDVKDIHAAIEKKDIYTEKGDRSFGIEEEFHATLLYGIEEGVKSSTVKELLKDFDFGELTIHNISKFDNDKYDVLKFDVKASSLNKANKLLRKELPYENDYPDYHAHATICYLKKGKADKYIEMFKEIKFKSLPSKIVYSVPSGTKHTIISYKKSKDK